MAMELDAAGHDITGDIASDTRATLVAEANGAAPGKTPATITVELDAGNTTVHLPAGTDTSHPVQVGNDLEFIQPDGSIILIPGGAVAGLVIFVGDIEIPADAVAALFSANNIQPAEGPQGPPEGTALETVLLLAARAATAGGDLHRVHGDRAIGDFAGEGGHLADRIGDLVLVGDLQDGAVTLDQNGGRAALDAAHGALAGLGAGMRHGLGGGALGIHNVAPHRGGSRETEGEKPERGAALLSAPA